MSKLLKFDTDSRQAVFSGVQELSKAVKVTLGAKGRNVIYERKLGVPSITKDGVTVAINVYLKDPFKDIGATIAKEAALRTNDIAGDGTTTAIVLTEAIISNGLSLLKKSKRISSVALKDGIDKGVTDVLSKLKSSSIEVSNDLQAIENVATISANNSTKVGKLIKAALSSVGNDGVIEIEKSQNFDTYIDNLEGMQVNGGYMSPLMITNVKKRTCEFDNPIIFVSNYVFSKATDIIPFMKYSVDKGRPIVMFVDDLKNEALQIFNQNLYEMKFQGVAIKTPSFSTTQIENMLDIAAVTGASAIDRNTISNLRNIDATKIPTILGDAIKVIVGKEDTTIIGGNSSKEVITKRIEQIDNDLAISHSNYDKERLMQRRGKLLGKVCIIYVGGISKMEMDELKDRVEDALNSTKSAVKEGIVPGGGAVLYHIANELLARKDNSLGEKLLFKALKVPLKQIILNAGLNVKKITKKINKAGKGIGYDVKNNRMCNMLEEGIIDPTLVTMTALENAASVAGTFLTTECVIAEELINE